MAADFLRNIRVLDLSQYIPGPFATRQLADLGADVIKIEPPQGDPMRFFGMPAADENTLSPVYTHLNRGKRILKLDLKVAEGIAVFERLLADADVLLESFRPGVLVRLGFDRKRLAELNPGLVHCALSGFGQTGVYRDRGGHDLTYCAVGGALSSADTQRQPMLPFPPLADHAGAMQASNTILAALLGKASGTSSQGAFLDISLCESALSWQYLQLSGAADLELLLTGGSASYNVYQTADHRFVVFAGLEYKFWKAFCQAVERPDWLGRQQEPLPQTDLIAEVKQLFAAKPLKHWQTLLSGVDCCFEPVPLLNEVSQHQQLQQRQMLSAAEPAYPGWINAEPVVTTQQMAEVESAEWRV
ncbi:MAG: CoA transferase [Thiolinea sp.]